MIKILRTYNLKQLLGVSDKTLGVGDKTLGVGHIQINANLAQNYYI